MCVNVSFLAFKLNAREGGGVKHCFINFIKNAVSLGSPDPILFSLLSDRIHPSSIPRRRLSSPIKIALNFHS